MIDRSILISHLDYTAWATGLLLDACAGLPEEELTRDLTASHGGVLETLRHIYYADRVWLARLHGEVRPFKDPTPPSFEDLQVAWPVLLTDFRQFVANLPEADLGLQLHYRNLKGDEKTHIRWQVLLHVVNHATLHRGQVMAMLRQLGHQPPATDLIYFYTSSNQTS